MNITNWKVPLLAGSITLFIISIAYVGSLYAAPIATLCQALLHTDEEGGFYLYSKALYPSLASAERDYRENATPFKVIALTDKCETVIDYTSEAVKAGAVGDSLLGRKSVEVKYEVVNE